MRKKPIGYFRKLIESYPEELQKMRIGIVNFSFHNPLISLEFLNDFETVKRPTEHMKSLNFKDDNVFNFVLNSIQSCKEDLKFDDTFMKLLIEALLNECKDLDTFLYSVEKISSFTNPIWIDVSSRHMF